MRRELGVRSLRMISSRSGPLQRKAEPRPGAPTSSERRPFCNDSLKVRPMDMASPTLFIEVVSSSLAPGNFSKVKRGILVTQ
ncbi:hypothetical protein DSECCO2_658790 [anaerobic digester metagenome]